MKMVRFVFLIIVLSSQLFADGTPAEGAGTENDPYQIETLDNLLWLSTTEAVWDSIYYFLQTQDIDASDTQNWNDGAGFSPIGWRVDHSFKASFNGESYSIDDIYINRPETFHVGLFGFTYHACIEDVHLINVNIIGNEKVGGLAGRNSYSSISNCTASGNVNGQERAGILAGSNSHTPVSECSVTGNVTGNHTLGGLIGSNSHSPITHCVANCIVTGEDFYIGGLSGFNSNSLINENSASGSVVGNSCVGGLIGYDTFSQIQNNYASCEVSGCDKFGGLLGYSIYSTITGSYYDYESVLINDQQLISMGALTSDLYNTWINNELTLLITDYLSFNGEYFLINNVQDFEKLLAFGFISENNYLLTEDIDLTTKPNFYIPFFAGSFNGDNYEITGLNVNIPENCNIGLFGYTYEATIEALGVTNINVNGNCYTGGLAGYNSYTQISDCYVTGIVTGGDYWIGGLTGVNDSSIITGSYSLCDVSGFYGVGGISGQDFDTPITHCYSSGNVNGELTAGGLVGQNLGSVISECYSECNVVGEEKIGGLAGENFLSILNNCYSKGSVSGYLEVGGIAGYNANEANIFNCYAVGNVDGDIYYGGIVGYNTTLASVSDCIWNIETTGQETGVGYNFNGYFTDLLGLTTTEMLMMSTYTDIGWDFWGESINGDEDIWGIEEDINEGYPYIYDIEYPVSIDETVIENVKLEIENYPNPFNPVTNICYELGKDGNVIVDIFNIKGQKVETLVNGYLQAGKHTTIWNADNRSSGIYFLRYETGSLVEIKKITLMK